MYSKRIAPVFTIHFYQDGGREEHFSSADWSEVQTYQPALSYDEVCLDVQFYGLPLIRLDNDYGRWVMWLEKTGKYLHDIEAPFLRWRLHANGYMTIVPIEEDAERQE